MVYKFFINFCLFINFVKIKLYFNFYMYLVKIRLLIDILDIYIMFMEFIEWNYFFCCILFNLVKRDKIGIINVFEGFWVL